MKTNYIIVASILIAIIGVGTGIYFWTLNKSLKFSLATAESQIQILKNEKNIPETKVGKSLAYAEYLDVLLGGAWKDAGLPLRFQLSDVDNFVELKNRTKSLNDGQLDDYLKKIETGNNAAVVQAMYYIIGKIEDSLK